MMFSAQNVGAVDSTSIGASLLDEGEVALTFGVGFPDLMFQFDFANSKSVNLAFKAKFNYNHGFSVFGTSASGTFPLRIGFAQESKLSMALKLEPGFFMGYFAGEIDSLVLGIPLGVGFHFSLQAIEKLIVTFGMDLPMMLLFEPTSRGKVASFSLPFEFSGGVEFEVDENYSIFARLNVGPMLYIGRVAERLNAAKSSVYLSGTARFMFGVVWRR